VSQHPEHVVSLLPADPIDARLAHRPQLRVQDIAEHLELAQAQLVRKPAKR
jgi:hypothetical protein